METAAANIYHFVFGTDNATTPNWGMYLYGRWAHYSPKVSPGPRARGKAHQALRTCALTGEYPIELYRSPITGQRLP